MDWFDLAYTTPDVIEKIKKAEQEGRFSDHLDPIEYHGTLPVDESFPYIPNVFLRAVYAFRKITFLNHFIKALNEKVLLTKVTGKENLKGVGAAVFICNHVNKYDALAVNYALGKRPLKIMVADFNNRPGFLGKMMRADGILPFKNTRACIQKFTEAVNYYLSHGTGVLFFPEGSEWWCYKKPRPFMDGAFHFAAANNVPVVPLFITFRETGRVRDGIDLPEFTVNILNPLYPDSEKTKKENVRDLKNGAFDACMKKYEQAYGAE